MKTLLQSRGYPRVELTPENTFISKRPIPELLDEINMPLTGKLASEVLNTNQGTLERIRNSYVDLLVRTKAVCYRELVNSGVDPKVAQDLTDTGAEQQVYMKQALECPMRVEPNLTSHITGK